MVVTAAPGIPRPVVATAAIGPSDTRTHGVCWRRLKACLARLTILRAVRGPATVDADTHKPVALACPHSAKSTVPRCRTFANDSLESSESIDLRLAGVSRLHVPSVTSDSASALAPLPVTGLRTWLPSHWPRRSPSTEPHSKRPRRAGARTRRALRQRSASKRSSASTLEGPNQTGTVRTSSGRGLEKCVGRTTPWALERLRTAHVDRAA